MRKLLILLLALLAPLAPARSETGAIAIELPPQMVETGFARHLLPRFKFRSRILLEPVAPGSGAALAVVNAPDRGEAILAGQDGTVYSLVFPPGDATAATFLKWLRSDTGRSTVEGFPRDGPPLFTLYSAPKKAVAETAVEGDAALGSRLALTHCGRCHVVDKRNRMGGIGSTPSFGALRARANWHDLFLKFWIEPPHPSFTLIPGMTEDFSETRPAHIHPVKLDQDEVDAIIAFIATMKPKNLGAPLGID